jgi:hypothetical protein
MVWHLSSLVWDLSLAKFVSMQRLMSQARRGGTAILLVKITRELLLVFLSCLVSIFGYLQQYTRCCQERIKTLKTLKIYWFLSDFIL